MQYHGARRPLHAERRDRRRDALLERDHRDRQSGSHAAPRRLERRPGGGVHVRPRPLGRLHAAGQPGLGRPGARRRRRDPPRRHVLRREGRRRRSPTGSTRARSRFRRPTSSSGCSSNLITLMERDRMPLPRFWYLPRGEKAVVVLSGDDHSPASAGGTASNFDRFKALSPPGCVVANWECVRSTSYIYPDSVLTNAQAAAVRRRRVRDRAPPASSVRARATDCRERSSQRVFDTQLAAVRGASTRACLRRSRAAPTASTGPTGRRARRSSSRTGSGWTPTTTTTPAAGSAPSQAS